MGRVELTELRDPSPFRKIAMGTWRTAKDPSVYGLIEIDMTAVIELLPAYSEKYQVKISASHLVGKAVAHAISRRPEINGMIRFGKIYLRKHIDIFYQVNIPGDGEDKVAKAILSGAVIRDCANLSVAEIARDLTDKAKKIRSGEDKEISKNMDAFKHMPWWMTGLYLDLGSFLLYTLNLNLSFFGLPKDPFGSVMVTNVGSLGIDVAWAPLCPYTRVPILFTVGMTKDKPWVVDGKVEVRSILPVAVTFDHRFIDGAHAAQMAADFRECFASPEKFLLAD